MGARGPGSIPGFAHFFLFSFFFFFFSFSNYFFAEEVEPQDAGPNGAEFVKQHPFFEVYCFVKFFKIILFSRADVRLKRVHWSDVPQKKLVPPIIPSTLRRKVLFLLRLSFVFSVLIF